MLKRIAIVAIAIIVLVSTSSYATIQPESPTASSDVRGAASNEAVRVAGLFESLAEQTAYILNSPQASLEDMERYADTIRSIATYSNCKQPLNEPDLKLIVDSFYSFVHAGGESITKDDIRADLCRYSTIGDVVGYLSSALVAGLSENG